MRTLFSSFIDIDYMSAVPKTPTKAASGSRTASTSRGPSTPKTPASAARSASGSFTPQRTRKSTNPAYEGIVFNGVSSSYPFTHDCESIALICLRLSDTLAVPIYDARGRSFEMNSTVLNNLKGTFPLYHADVPAGSCCVVAYTANRYLKQADKQKEHPDCNIGLNLQYVILLAMP